MEYASRNGICLYYSLEYPSLGRLSFTHNSGWHPRLLWHTLLELISIDLRPELATITIPTLIIWGERDLLVPLPLGQALFRALPHAYFVSLPNCAHRPHFTEPEKFSRLVVEFSNR